MCGQSYLSVPSIIEWYDRICGGPSPGLRFPGQCNGKDLKKGSSEPDSMQGDGRDFRRSTLNPGLKQ